ncbi:hypothetical protein P280DRAFT_518271 [Massarina eburnea CBS 473.64]|uniref:Uncharacterized protein n=1 Tax=Massarina eburnea CBS 473.64 TaxID=1395130 RepID=A0A6A6S198_9PLEO|nr:hypothetical protein P280DRAFT_518271 [Massarina eburnea CBS 473.64]
MVNRAPSSSASDSAIDVADSSDAGHINQPIAAAADASVVATMESEAGADSGRASRNSARHRNDDHFIEPALVETNLDNTPSKLSIKKKPGRKRNSSGIFVKKDMPEPKKARVSAASKATRGGRRGRTRLSNAKISDSSEEARSADPTAPIEEENGVGTPEATTVTGTNTPGIESTRLSTETSEYVPNKASTRGTTEDTGDVSMVDASDFDGGARDEQTEAPGSARESSFVRQPDMDKATVHAAAMEFVQQGLAEAAKTRTPSPAAQEDHVVHASTPEPKPVQPIEPVQAAVQASVAADTSSGASVPQPATAATLATSTSSGASVTQPAVTLATGTVEFLVRVHTSTGQVELPVPEVFLSDNIKLASRAHKYVEYKRGKEAKGAVAVSFEQWNEIVDGIDM